MRTPDKDKTPDDVLLDEEKYMDDVEYDYGMDDDFDYEGNELEEAQEIIENPEPRRQKRTEARRSKSSPGRLVLKIIAFFLATVLILVMGLYGAMWVLVKGPSPTAKKLFVRSVKETSAIGFLANIYLSNEEVAEIMSGGASADTSGETDVSLINIKKPETAENAQPGGAAPENDGGIEIFDIKGPSFRGKLMIVKDPMRTFLATPPSFGGAGVTLADLVSQNSALAGINGGGFDDPGGTGNGGRPEGIVIKDGVLLSDEKTNGRGFWTAVLDNDGILHVGWMTGYQAADLGARWAVSFGPILVQNGKKYDGLESGLNPRTAIGQRADGAMLMLVVDGRQVDSLGATCGEIADIMLEYGAVNAMNLDGGSSTMMIYDGNLLNTCASVVGARPLPTAILVR